jgi:transposase
MASAGLVAYVVSSKYEDALPFYRQEKQFRRIGVELSRATMCGWAIEAARRCSPLIGLLEEEVRSGPLVRADETVLQVLKEPGRAATTKSYMWVFMGGALGRPAATIFRCKIPRKMFAAKELGAENGVKSRRSSG